MTAKIGPKEAAARDKRESLMKTLVKATGGDASIPPSAAIAKTKTAFKNSAATADDLAIPGFLKRAPETPEQEAARLAKQAKAPAPALKVIVPGTKPTPKASEKSSSSQPADAKTAAASKQESDMRTSKQKKAATSKARTKVEPKTKTKKAETKRATYDWKGASAAALKGVVPKAPDFSANTHRSYRGLLDEVEKLVKARDLKALTAFKVKGTCSSPTAVKKYQKIAITALQAKK